MGTMILNLDATGRVLSAGRYAKAPEGAVFVEETDFPDGDLYEYRYVDGTFVYDPLPAEPEPEPEEDRVTALENRLAEMEAAYAKGVQSA